MKTFLDEYCIDYRTKDQDVKKTDKPTTKAPKNMFSKLLATTLLFLLIIVIVYEAYTSKENAVLFASTSISDTREYDDFLFPIVIQDPKPFSSIKDAEPLMLISASVWKTVLSKRFDQFDQDGFSVISLDEILKNFDILFGQEHRPILPAHVENDLFVFDAKDRNFHIKPTTNQKCYIPYTDSCVHDNQKIILKVGYVSPNDKWRSLKNDRPQRPSPTKFMLYTLKKEKNFLHIESIVSE